jgi:hypothetical protein
MRYSAALTDILSAWSPVKALSRISRPDLLKYMGSAGLALAAGKVWPQTTTSNPVAFVDVAGPAGITFRHDNAASPDKYLVETMGSGCGWIDYD